MAAANRIPFGLPVIRPELANVGFLGPRSSMSDSAIMRQLREETKFR
jgi:hypothetical protein